MLSKSLARLSSGSKITSPADDSAGLAVSMKLTAQMGRIDAANNNVGNAISFNQTQDGYLQKVGDALNRMSELAVLAQDVTNTSADTSLTQNEFITINTLLNDE
jgi:flagellin